MESLVLSAQKHFHRWWALNRRIEVLAGHVAMRLDRGVSILDVGCGSGEIAARIRELRPDVTIRGIDVLVRPDSAIPVERYDGQHFPAGDDSYDVVTLIDVLHHTPDPMPILREALRVARTAVIIKDHNCDSAFNRRVMTFTDWFGNRQYGVRLLFNFWRENQWKRAWSELGVQPVQYTTELGIYPWHKRLLFARNMDFIVKIPAVGRE